MDFRRLFALDRKRKWYFLSADIDGYEIFECLTPDLKWLKAGNIVAWLDANYNAIIKDHSRLQYKIDIISK